LFSLQLKQHEQTEGSAISVGNIFSGYLRKIPQVVLQNSPEMSQAMKQKVTFGEF